ncbi:MAG TPA: ankyrin repeat domain-containing protein [Caulobacteraceae bacterium]|jgi:hypothetical protein
MPEHRDPIDRAYTQAEELLDDSNSRAARRSRILGAVAQEPLAHTAPNLSSHRRPAWRRGDWLAAASIAGLGVFLATRVYQSAPQPLRTMPTPPPFAPAASEPARTSLPPAAAKTISRAGRAPTLKSAAPAPLAAIPPSLDIRPVASPPMPAPMAARAFPAEASPPPSQQVIVTAERRASPPAAGKSEFTGGTQDDSLGALGSALMAKKPAPPPPAAPLLGSEADAGSPSVQAGNLRAASAGGRLSEIETLLALGVPVDAPDVDGETALMKSIRADEPAAAALLLRHGARLDQRNRAGMSARQMATAVGDPALERAVGLKP